MDFEIILYIISDKLLCSLKRSNSAKMRQLIEDSVTVLVTQVIFFLIGWIFFVKMLFRDYELHHYLVQLIFCINFTLSLTMFELIIFEIVDFLDIGSRYLVLYMCSVLHISGVYRYFHWYFAIYSMLFMVIVLTPFYIIYFVLSSR